MPIAKILIITDRNDRTTKFSSSPYNLPIESFLATGLDSLEYIGLQGYTAILIDFEATNLIRKVALGINDDPLSEAMWSLLAPDCNGKVYFLTDKIAPATRDMRALGIEFILSSEVLSLAGDNNEVSITSTGSEHDRLSDVLLTADDIRSLHKAGNTVVAAGTRMTSWAKEVADTLGLIENQVESTFILPVSAQTKSQLISEREKYFSLTTSHQNLFFAMPSAIIPLFNEMFPSLCRRVIAIGINWEEKGAFTGENSINMLTDMGCHGAILVNKKPYTEVENIVKLFKLVSSSGFRLFSFFPLAQDAECGIIDRKDKSLLCPIVDARFSSEKSSGLLGAMLVDDKYLEKVRKGI